MLKMIIAGGLAIGLLFGAPTTAFTQMEETSSGSEETSEGVEETHSIAQNLTDQVNNTSDPEVESLRDKALLASVIVIAIGTSILWIIVKAGTSPRNE